MNNLDLSKILRFLPLMILLSGGALYYFYGPGPQELFDLLQDRYGQMDMWVDAHALQAASLHILIYICAVALSLPLGLVLTVAGGFVFGLFQGVIYSVIGATVGACLLFLAARTALGSFIEKKAGSDLIRKVHYGFESGMISYLMLMRLVPLVPFFVANVAPAFFRVKLHVYFLTTFFGIMPGCFVYTSIGNGLRASFVELSKNKNIKHLSLDDVKSAIFLPENLVPIIGLCILAILPLIVKFMLNKYKENQKDEQSPNA